MDMSENAFASRFGEALRNARGRRLLGLREFCKKAGLDPGLVSRIERGLAPPPTDQQVLAQFAEGLDVNKKSREWQELSDLASVSRGEIPAYVLSDPEIAGRLPVLFRAMKDVKSDEELVERLVDIIKKS